MKKMFTLFVFVSFICVTNLNSQFTKVWSKLCNGSDYWWFNTAPSGNNNVVALAYNPVTDKVITSVRNSRIYVLNAATGALEDSLNTTGVGVESFKYNKIRITSDGVIYAISMMTATPPGICKIYRWETQSSTPTECASFTVTERTGDAFALSGTGTSTVLYASGAAFASAGTSNTNVYVLTTVNGTNFLNTATISVASGTSQWTNRSIDPIGATAANGLWIDMSGGPARRLNVTGSAPSLTATAAFTSSTGTGIGQVPDSYCGMRYLQTGSGKKYLAFAGANNAGDGVVMRMLDVTNEASITTVGTDTLYSGSAPFTYQNNGNGTGDVAFKNNGNGSYTIFYLATNNGIAAVTSAITLPVSLTGFTASLKNQVAVLNWSTLSESNNSGFAIEKSIDGTNFSSIGFVASKALNGNSNNAINYIFEDKAVAAGKTYYRLKQMDKDGKTSYSPTESVEQKTSVTLAIKALQNPVQGNLVLNVKSNTTRTVNINIINTAGKTVYAKQYVVNAGENNFNIAGDNLPKGNLFVTVNDSNNSLQQSIQVFKQ
jgi:hypothetical protein